MLFNSVEYILCFLPLTFITYFTLNKYKLYNTSLIFLLISSLYFYSTYNIKFSITPFIEQNTIDVSSASIIDAAFRTAHHNTVYSDGTQDFPQANAGGTADGNPPDAGSTAAGSPSDPDDPSTNQNHKEAELKDSISPASGNVRQWIFRGAVLMAVSQKDFDRAPTGEYRATVKATLTTN